MVVGKSRLVGSPLAILLMHSGATVDVCHRLTKDLSEHTKTADLVFVAAGSKHLIKPAHVKDNVVIVDVGIHVENKVITGDVDPTTWEKTKAYSPVPGGVGPMTVAGLMENVARIFLSNQKKS